MVQPGDFGPFDGRAWLNCAQQGPLPRAAAQEAERAIAEKVAPARMAEDEFQRVPQRLKQALADFIGARPEEIVLGNSTSYGLQKIANGLDWRAGDEALVVRGDFPASVLPWYTIERRGAKVRFIEPSGPALAAAEVEAALTPRTRVVCATWVNSFNGWTLDLEAVGRVCRRRGALLVLNAAQAIGARGFQVGGDAEAPADAVVACGYKWLCGPYATGFAWISPGLLDQLTPDQVNWGAMQQGRTLDQMRDFELRSDLGAVALDVFCTGHFQSFAPWAAAVEYLGQFGSRAIASYDQQLVEQFAAGLDGRRYSLLSPRQGEARSTLIVISHRERARNPGLHQQLAAEGVDISLREDNLRLSPHLFNTASEIDRALDLLHRLA